MEKRHFHAGSSLLGKLLAQEPAVDVEDDQDDGGGSGGNGDDDKNQGADGDKVGIDNVSIDTRCACKYVYVYRNILMIHIFCSEKCFAHVGNDACCKSLGFPGVYIRFVIEISFPTSCPTLHALLSAC